MIKKPLKDQYRHNVGIFMQNMRQNKVPVSFTNLNYVTAPERFTRQSQHEYANQKRAQTKFSSLLPFHQMPNIWNELDHDLKEIPTLNMFRKRTHAYLLGKYENNMIYDNPRCGQCSATEIQIIVWKNVQYIALKLLFYLSTFIVPGYYYYYLYYCCDYYLFGTNKFPGVLMRSLCFYSRGDDDVVVNRRYIGH